MARVDRPSRAVVADSRFMRSVVSDIPSSGDEGNRDDIGVATVREKAVERGVRTPEELETSDVVTL